MANRVGVVSRKTNETDIQMELNLDGSEIGRAHV